MVTPADTRTWADIRIVFRNTSTYGCIHRGSPVRSKLDMAVCAPESQSASDHQYSAGIANSVALATDARKNTVEGPTFGKVIT